MAFKMRLYHRRSSASRERLLSATAIATDAFHSFKDLDTRGARGSFSAPRQQLHVPTSRPRSLSLHPGMEHGNCLMIPQRSRSNSFSGIQSRNMSLSEGPCGLTSSEEDYVFKCYATIMYLILGATAAAIVFFLLYSLHCLSQLDKY